MNFEKCGGGGGRKEEMWKTRDGWKWGVFS